MIHVDRSRVSAPAVLGSTAAKTACELARKFFDPKFKPSSAKFIQRLQERFEWNWALLREARPALDKLFHSKCAFCESLDSTDNPLDVGHFRPITEVVDSTGEGSAARSSTGYWWLAYEWENLYLICRACSDRSQVSFPIEGRLAAPGTLGAALLDEQPLLLDPCADEPSEYLGFVSNAATGTVVARHGLPSLREARAAATIEYFSLNREPLIALRRNAINVLQSEWNAALGDGKVGPRAKRFPTQLGADRPYLAALREQSARLAAALIGRLSARDAMAATMLLAEVVPGMAGLARPVPATPAPQAAPEPPRSTRRGKRRRRMPSAHGWYLRRVEIANFKAISRLALDIPRVTGGESDRKIGWKVLLGENGTGKSSVLQAIVLAFMGERFVRSEGIAPRSLLRRQGNGKIASAGFVKLFWVDLAAPTVMRFRRGKIVFEGQSPPSSLVLRAYGATRHLPRGRHKATAEAHPKDVENLFDPFRPVCDADTWLRQRRGAKAFGSAALSLKDLLGMSSRTRVSRRGGRVWLRIGGVDVTLDEMSAGYQSVVVLAVDIIAAVYGQTHDLRYASGIVLIDELDAHLHPRWKMQIVPSLRRTFPGLQFIATTHEPLCLRGLRSGEIAVMHRENRVVKVVTELPSPEGLRVDQLLTSPLFGLHSTVDPDADRDFQRYYQLLAKASLTENESGERDALSKRLTEAGILGMPVVGPTRRDQLIYEAVDQYLAREPLMSVNERMTFKDETKKKVADIWRDVLSTTTA